ncbi:MAG TPA: ferritin-like domain-containing protein [Thermoanaerobaculia bacterium]|jgi:ferritin-like metal-binding protein YciE|nr:ferritin-like domain-containing protein [Thermoanaerobaculia bacterium]
MGSLTRSSIPLVRYRLARAALDLRSFTVAELVTLTGVPVGTVYSFLSKLSLNKEALPAATPGRPREVYTLTDQAVEKLLDENFEIAKTLREAGLAASQDHATVEIQEAREVHEPRRCQGGMRLESLRKLYVEELKDLYSAERQILQALPRMARKVRNEPLKRAFEDHVQVTEMQVERLDRIFEDLGKSARGKKSKMMEGLIEEAKEMMQEEDMEPEILDTALLSAAQKIEHYQIASYGTVRTYAQVLGEDQHVRLLQKTLDEEQDADKNLTRLAESSINVEVEARA